MQPRREAQEEDEPHQPRRGATERGPCEGELADAPPAEALEARRHSKAGRWPRPFRTLASLRGDPVDARAAWDLLGEEHFEENLRFVTEALGVKDLRDYFVKSFYRDHVQRYKKRPIYWLFSSPKGSFNALIYMHRYTPSTASTVLNEYLREFRAKLDASRQHHERLAVDHHQPHEVRRPFGQQRPGSDKGMEEIGMILVGPGPESREHGEKE